MNPQQTFVKTQSQEIITIPKNEVEKGKETLVLCSSMKLYVREVQGKGRGVFASIPLKPGGIIEICPLIILDEADAALTEQTALKNYSFDWSKPYGLERAFPLGFGMLYNHSYQPNARYLRNPMAKTITFVALRTIPAHEEILVNYNGNPSCMDPLFPDMRPFEMV